MKGAAVTLLAAGLSVASAFVPTVPHAAVTVRRQQGVVSMGLNAELTKTYPRDFKNIPTGTSYGKGEDATLNKEIEIGRAHV